MVNRGGNSAGTLYEQSHTNTRYRLLNSLNTNLMDRSDTITGYKSQINMNGVLRDILAFKEANNEDMTIDTWSGTSYAIVKVPAGIAADDYYNKAKRWGWIESTLTASLDSGMIGDAICCMLDYLLTRHGKETKEQLYDLGLIPKLLDEYEIAATMKQGNMGIGQWRELVKCFKTYMEIDKLCVSESCWRRLGVDHGNIQCDRWKWNRGADKRVE